MNALTLKQGALVTPREPIAFGRFKAHPGQTFWVTDSGITRAQRGTIHLARSGRNSGAANAFTLADAEKFFTAVSTL